MYMLNKSILIVCVAFFVLFSNCRKAEPFPDDEYDSRLSGGTQTVFDQTSHAFGHVFEGLGDYELRHHELGDAAFEQTFVAAPAPVNNGLGVVYNNVSCISCHHNDGIGTPTAGELQSSLLIRISRQGMDDHGGALAVPGYGTQIQDKAVFGKQKEATVHIAYTYHTYSLANGTTYELRAPVYSLENLYLPVSGVYMLSPRLAPPVFGLGLLENIEEKDILANADENDSNGDSISGKPNYVWDAATQKMMLGRFGLKANTASVLTQVAAAYNNDMGITNRIFPAETYSGQTQMDLLKDDPELPDSILNAVAFYVRTLQVPARRNVNDAEGKKGEKLFAGAKCMSCHTQTFTTNVNVAFPPSSNQRIHPYTDLLLHDMGEGLADNRPDFKADGREWRTAPLWGLGLIELVNYPGYYLHDGRARSILEAIMWHSGEAEASKRKVQEMSKTELGELLRFLKSL
jgi:CxxC motif-containing protein (DUF1111 family)